MEGSLQSTEGATGETVTGLRVGDFVAGEDVIGDKEGFFVGLEEVLRDGELVDGAQAWGFGLGE
jgi:hypothetical protein